MNYRQKVIKTIQLLPAHVSPKEVLDRVLFLMAIEEAQESLKKGEAIPHEDAVKELKQWMKKRATKSSGRGKH